MFTACPLTSACRQVWIESVEADPSLTLGPSSSSVSPVLLTCSIKIAHPVNGAWALPFEQQSCAAASARKGKASGVNLRRVRYWGGILSGIDVAVGSSYAAWCELVPRAVGSLDTLPKLNGRPSSCVSSI